jgi:hypothetical protein
VQKAWRGDDEGGEQQRHADRELHCSRTLAELEILNSARVTLSDDSEGASIMLIFMLPARRPGHTHDTRAIAAGSEQEMRSAISIGVDVLSLSSAGNAPTKSTLLCWHILCHGLRLRTTTISRRELQEILTTQSTTRLAVLPLHFHLQFMSQNKLSLRTCCPCQFLLQCTLISPMQVLGHARFLFKQDARKYLEVASNGNWQCVTELSIAISKLQKTSISCFQIEQTSHMPEACLSAHLRATIHHVRSLCN